jgi:hypothetical protein
VERCSEAAAAALLLAHVDRPLEAPQVVAAATSHRGSNCVNGQWGDLPGGDPRPQAANLHD